MLTLQSKCAGKVKYELPVPARELQLNCPKNCDVAVLDTDDDREAEAELVAEVVTVVDMVTDTEEIAVVL
jgi:hypothetical protein